MPAFVTPRGQFRRIQRWAPFTLSPDAPPRFVTAAPTAKPRITKRRKASLFSTVYSIPREHVVFIDPIVIEFTVVDPQVRRTGGWVAGSDMVRPIGARTVRSVD